MTPESIRMSDLILEAEDKCLELGHDMDWRRYSNQWAVANCRKCPAWISVRPNYTYYKIFRFNIDTNCTNTKGG